jgi:hypothetical protein
MADVERSNDGRWVIVNGRRWRASDPAIPAPLHTELVNELMSARQAVGRAVRAGDDEATTRARARVHDAKVALGERGQPWWESPDPAARDARIEATVFALLAHRSGRSICPSDVARVAGGQGWRAQMDDVRRVAFDLTNRGRTSITQKGEPVDTQVGLRGPIRITSADPEERLR